MCLLQLLPAKNIHTRMSAKKEIFILVDIIKNKFQSSLKSQGTCACLLFVHLFVCWFFFVRAVFDMWIVCSFLSHEAHWSDLPVLKPALLSLSCPYINTTNTNTHIHINTWSHTCTHSHTHVKDSRVGWSRVWVWSAGCVSWSDANILSHCSLSAHLACSALLLWSDWSRTDCAPRRAGRLCKCAWSSSHIRRLPVVWSFFQPVRCLASFCSHYTL